MGELLISVIYLGLIFGIPYYIYKQIAKKIKEEVHKYKFNQETKKRELEDKKVIDEHIEVVEKGLVLYNMLKKYLQNPEFAEFVFDTSGPEFIRKDNCIMIVLPIVAKSSSIEYWEEVYTKLKKEGKAPCSFWLESTNGCEDCSGNIVEEFEYVIAYGIGRVNRRDEIEIRHCAWLITGEILKK